MATSQSDISEEGGSTGSPRSFLSEKLMQMKNKIEKPYRFPSAASDGWDPETPRFLQEGEFNCYITLASYPRCGNSLLRSLIEQIQGIITGSDTRPDRSLSVELRKAGLLGEGVVDNSVNIVKTHFPERHGHRYFYTKSVILLVRNPFDAIDSYFNMNMTNTHNQSVSESQYERFAEQWELLVPNELDIWRKFYNFWLKQKIPLILLRYEDLLCHREATLRRLFKFLARTSDLTKTVFEERIQVVLNVHPTLHILSMRCHLLFPLL